MAKQFNEQETFGDTTEDELEDILSGETGNAGEGETSTAGETTAEEEGASDETTAESPTGETGAGGETTIESETTETGATGQASATGATGAETGATGEQFTEEDVFDKPAEGQTTIASTDVKEYDFKDAGKKLGLQVESNDEQSFFASVKKAIEDASQKTEVDLSGYNEETQTFIKSIEDPDSSLVDVISPITSIDHYLINTKPEQIVTDWFVDVDKMTLAEAREQITELQVTEDFDDKYKEILGKYNDAKVNLTVKMTEDLKIASEGRKKEGDSIVDTERNSMIDVVKELNDFVGIKIPESTKTRLIGEINSGVLTRENNNAATQVKARLFDLFSKNVTKFYEERIKEEKRKSYNEGSRNIKGGLHNTTPEGEQISAAENRYKDKAGSGALSGFEDFEDEVGVIEEKEK